MKTIKLEPSSFDRDIRTHSFIIVYEHGSSPNRVVMSITVLEYDFATKMPGVEATLESLREYRAKHECILSVRVRTGDEVTKYELLP